MRPDNAKLEVQILGSGVILNEALRAQQLLAEKFGIKEREGALVADVTPEGPADKAGLQNGDVILEFDGKPVRDSRHLKLQVAQVAPGKQVPVKISRDGDDKELKVTLKEFPKDKELAKGKTASGSSGDPTDGIAVEDLTAAARQQFNIPSNVKGALVTDVDPESPGAQAGPNDDTLVVTMTNDPTSNEIKVYDAASQALLQSLSTHGKGGVTGNARGVVQYKGELVAVVNYGTNSVALFQRTGRGLQFQKLVTTSSAPVSIDFGNSHMYVAGVTTDAHRNAGVQVAEEMLRVLRGERPHVLVNPDVWPRLGVR